MIRVYTDGGYRPNYNMGAWGYVVVKNDNILFSESEAVVMDKTLVTITNNKMEMLAIIRAMENLLKDNSDKNNDVYIFTDSQYVQLGITKWSYNWEINGWKTSSNKPVKNYVLWRKIKELFSLCEEKFNSITVQWVQGHGDNKWNNFADELCNKAMDAKIIEVDKNEI